MLKVTFATKPHKFDSICKNIGFFWLGLLIDPSTYDDFETEVKKCL